MKAARERSFAQSPQITSHAEEGFIPGYASMGQFAMGVLSRVLAAGEKGVPVYEQTVVVSSSWGVAAAGPAR